MSVALSTTDEAQRRIRLKALWRLAAQNDLRLQQADAVRLYKVTLSVIPERWTEIPVRRELLCELKL